MKQSRLPNRRPRRGPGYSKRRSAKCGQFAKLLSQQVVDRHSIFGAIRLHSLADCSYGLVKLGVRLHQPKLFPKEFVPDALGCRTRRHFAGAHRGAALRQERAQVALDRIRPKDGKDVVSPAMLEKFCIGRRENIATDDIGFRRTYLRSVVDRIEVDDDVIRVIGDKATLEDVIAGKPGVRSLARK